MKIGLLSFGWCVWACALLLGCSSSSTSGGKDATDATAVELTDAPASDVPVDLSPDALPNDLAADLSGDLRADSADLMADVPDDQADTSPFTCTVNELAVPVEKFFTDVSAQSGMRAGNYVTSPTASIPINDHSRLGFVDINGDGYDDIVAHSLYPNPQAGIPFDHVVSLNNGDGTYTDFSEESGLKEIQAGFFAFGDVDNDGDVDCFAGVDVELSGATHRLLLNDGAGHFTVKPHSGLEVPNVLQAVGNAVFGDFNNDGKLDLYLGLGHTNYAVQDRLFMGDGTGVFTDATDWLAGNPARPTNGTVTCDFDNDGDLDIVVSTYSVSTELGMNILWQNDGTGHFTNVAVEKGFAALATGNYYLTSTEHGTKAEPGKSSGTYVGSNGFGVDCDDVNNDGNMDIFLSAISHPVESDYMRKWSDPTQLLFNLGPYNNYAFKNRFLELGLPFNEGDVDADAIDFDNDGRMDLSLSRDNKYEPNYTEVEQLSWFGLMHQKADGMYESLGYMSGINNPDGAYTASLTECTTDAECVSPETCLFSRCRMPCTTDSDCLASWETCIWLWNGDLAKAQPFCRPVVEMKKAQNHAWSDVDHDGDLDLLVGGRDVGGGRPNFLFRNDIGQSNRWLAMRVEGDGVLVNRDGIGTRVQVVFADRTLTREVQASRGMYNSMDGLAVHFGLGDLPCTYTLKVRWPNGTTAEFPAGTFPERAYLRLSYPDVLSW